MPVKVVKKTPEEVAGEMYSLTATAIEKGEFGFEMLAMHIPYALGKNQDGFVAWRRRAVPPEGKIVELDRFEDYLLLPVREGFGLPSLHFVDSVLRALGEKGKEALDALKQEIPDWTERVRKSKNEQTANEVPTLAVHGAIGNGRKDESRGDIGTSTRGSNSADYLAARIKRDAPEIAERMKRGEFKSVRAAAVAAGIVKLNTHLDVAKRVWRKMTSEEQQHFLAWISNA